MIVKIKCNGPVPHINDIDLDSALRQHVALRGESSASPSLNVDDMPERLVLPCRECTHKVILSRETIRSLLEK